MCKCDFVIYGWYLRPLPPRRTQRNWEIPRHSALALRSGQSPLCYSPTSPYLKKKKDTATKKSSNMFKEVTSIHHTKTVRRMCFWKWERNEAAGEQSQERPSNLAQFASFYCPTFCVPSQYFCWRTLFPIRQLTINTTEWDGSSFLHRHFDNLL